MCAGDYALTGPNVNSCPANYSRIENERDCERAAAAAGLPATVITEDLPTYAKGCQLVSYNLSIDSVFVVLNAIVGKPNPFGQLLCQRAVAVPMRTPTPSPTTLTQSPRVGIVATGTPISQAPIIAVVAPSAPPSKASPTASSQQMLLTTAPGNATVKSSSDAKAIAGGIGGAVAAVLLVVGAVILRKTCRKLKAKDAAKPDASTHELQRKDRAEALKLGAGASLATNAPWLRLVTAGRWLQVGRWLLRLRPPLCFRPDSMHRWRLRRRLARCAQCSQGVLG